MSQRLIGHGSVACSVAVHFALLVNGTDGVRCCTLPPRPSVVEFTVAPPVRAKAPPEVVVEPPAPAPKLAAKAPARAPQKELPAEEAKVPEEAPPPALTGTTLSSEVGAGWTAPDGNGSSREGAVQAGFSRLVGEQAPAKARTNAPTGAAKPSLPATTPLAELSRKPVPPPLEGALARNYPPSARGQGKSGEAKVRARIDASGRVSLAKVSAESAEGFGEACRRTLLGSSWSPPLDKSGHPVATWVTYRCKFRIE